MKRRGPCVIFCRHGFVFGRFFELYSLDIVVACVVNTNRYRRLSCARRARVILASVQASVRREYRRARTSYPRGSDSIASPGSSESSRHTHAHPSSFVWRAIDRKNSLCAVRETTSAGRYFFIILSSCTLARAAAVALRAAVFIRFLPGCLRVA